MLVNTRLIWVVPLTVLIAGVLAHALVYWTPWFGARADFGFSRPFEAELMYPEYIDTLTPDVIGVWSDGRVRELAKLQPAQFQSIVETLFKELVRLQEAELYMLNAAGDDVCLSPWIDCQGVPGKNVRPFVEKALAHKQARESASIAAGSLDTARQSLVVSIFALLVGVGGWVVAFLTWRDKRKSAASIE